MNNKLKHITNKPVPYNTGKVKIGEHYLPPQRDYMTPEGEHWQNVLTGVYQSRRKDRTQFITYVVALVFLFILLGVTS